MLSYLKIYDPVNKKNIDTLTNKGGKILSAALYESAYKI